jgi:putative ABC transport system ATP-binding protein
MRTAGATFGGWHYIPVREACSGARTGAVSLFGYNDDAPHSKPPRTLPAATPFAMLAVRGLSKAYAGPRPRTVFTDVDLDLGPGDYVAVMGESGIGKSTLLNLIAGLEAADRGSIALDGIELSALDDDARTALRRRSLGFVFQAFHILPYLSVAQNVGLPLSLLGAASDETARRAAAMLEQVNLGERGTSMPRELSGGELQRVAIARALIHGPRLVLADEPTGNLDPDSAGQVLRLLRERIKANGAAGILVTHSRMAAETADRILLLTQSGLAPAGATPTERGEP